MRDKLTPASRTAPSASASPAPAGFVHAIGLGRATAMVIGTIIGASIFVQPSLVSGDVPSTTGVLLVWAAAGALTLIGALVTAELSSAYPRTGGVYVFLREGYGPAVAYLWGWAMFWSMHSGIVAAIATVFARYLGHFIDLGDAGTRAAAVGSILALSAVNYVGVRWGSALQTLFTVVKVLAVVTIVVLGAVFVFGGGGGSATPASDAAAGDLSAISGAAFISAMVAGLFAYGGWHMVTYSSGETVDPARTIPRALLIGTLVVTAAYMAMTAVYMYVMPLDQVAASTRVAADLADTLLGSGGAGAMSGIVMFSTFGGLAGIILAGPRVYYAMAKDGLLFRWFGDVHPRYATPHRAILLQAVWASLLVATGTFRALFTRVVYTEWIFFGLMAIGMMLLRRRPGVQRQYSIPWYPVAPLLFVIASFAIVAWTLAANLRDSAIGLGLVLLGLPVYALWMRRGTGAA
jgi:APA family basic amino acid/polyamine antiporter